MPRPEDPFDSPYASALQSHPEDEVLRVQAEAYDAALDVALRPAYTITPAMQERARFLQEKAAALASQANLALLDGEAKQ